MTHSTRLVNALAYAPWHHHRLYRFASPGAGVDHVGLFELCRCGASRSTTERRWHRKQPVGKLTVRNLG